MSFRESNENNDVKIGFLSLLPRGFIISKTIFLPYLESWIQDFGDYRLAKSLNL